MDSTAAVGAALFGAVYVLVRHSTLESIIARDAKRQSARQLPRPKSFLIVEKATAVSVKEEVAGKNTVIGTSLRFSLYHKAPLHSCNKL